MGALFPFPHALQDQRSQARQGADIPAKKKRASVAKNKAAEGNRSTKRLCVATIADVRDAIALRLSSVPAGIVDALVQRLDAGASLDLILAELRTGDRGASLLYAAVARRALEAGDLFAAGMAGAELLRAMRAGDSRRGSRTPLMQAAEQFKRDFPSATSDDALDHLLRNGLVMFDGLMVIPATGNAVQYDSFVRAYRRI